MSSGRFIFAFFAVVILILAGVAGFNFMVDPMCYYRCDTLDTTRATENVYYQAAQTLAANPDAEIIVLGSSRAERISPRWISKVTGKKTVNLSQGGAELLLKMALSNLALKNNKNLKRVIWMADYFELNAPMTDSKVRWTPILSQNIESEHEFSLSAELRKMQGLIDHNTLEASFALLKSQPAFLELGNGQDLDYEQCIREDFLGKTPASLMQQEVNSVYPRFGAFLLMSQSEDYWRMFSEQLKKLAHSGVEVLIFVTPYNPMFVDRLSKEHPESIPAQKKWVDRMKSFQNERIKVIDFSQGVPGDDAGPRFWEDGVHPTCHMTIKMMGPSL